MTPDAVAAAVLRARFGEAHAQPGLDGLADFQQHAVTTLLHAMRRFGGALLADSVGLGKTHVAAAVADSLAVPDREVLVCAPTSVLPLWLRLLRHRPWRWRTASHATLGRGGARGREYGLIVVDEAHAFRNPLTRRYRALAQLAARCPHVLLLTATPINNGVMDLYWLLRLFAADDGFTALGVPDLYSCFDNARTSGRPGRVPAILAAVAVRRTRGVVAELYGADSKSFRFPESAEPRVLEGSLPARARTLVPLLARELELPAWHSGDADSATALVRMMLLKRLDSSVAALQSSLDRIDRVTAAFIDALDAGRLLGPADARIDYAEGEQLVLPELVLRPLPAGFDVASARAAAGRDRDRLRRASSMLRSVEDRKFDRLLALIDGELAGRKLIIFTEYRSTATYLWQRLRDRVPSALIHGTGAYLGAAPAARGRVVARFAPLSNRATLPHAREVVQVLIATDVIAEGLNLQDAADVLSYELPWNPVRVIQRTGRIDRLGSPHARVQSWYFTPDPEVDAAIRLLSRLHGKVHAIDSTLGGDAPILTRVALPDVQRQHLRLFHAEERLRLAWRSRTDAPRTGPATRCWTTLCRAEGDPPAQAVVWVQYGATVRAVFVGEDRCFEDEAAAAEILLRALQTRRSDGSAELLGPHRIVRQALYWLERTALAPPDPAGPDLQRRLLNLLAERHGGPSPADCLRAETLLRRIGSRRPPLLPRAAGADFDAFCDYLETWAQQRHVPSPPVSPPGPPQLIGMLVLTSG